MGMGRAAKGRAVKILNGEDATDFVMAVNHILGSTVIAILAIPAVPTCAQVQQPDMMQLKADAQNDFKIISSDKFKIRTFCEIADLDNQLDQADRVHDTATTMTYCRSCSFMTELI